jgi:hypothetical protein
MHHHQKKMIRLSLDRVDYSDASVYAVSNVSAQSHQLCLPVKGGELGSAASLCQLQQLSCIFSIA